MSAPNEKAGDAATSTGLEAGSPREQTNAQDSTSRAFAVICKRDDGGRRLFGRYATRAEAEHFATALRKVGCPAEIEERREGQPEFGTSRRAFLIYALACGLVPPERVTERILSEVGNV